MYVYAFFEFRVFYPFARSYSDWSPAKCYKKVGQIRKLEYGQRVREVEDGDFTPMIMSSTGGMCAEMSMALKNLAQRIADKTNERYADVMSMMRCSFSFAIARAALVCLRGSRSLYPARSAQDPMRDVELGVSECGLR